MKIAIIRQRYNPFGGAERFVERALAGLERSDIDVTLITRRWNGPAGSFHRLVCDPFFIGRTWRDTGFARAACAVVRDGGFDLVQSHEKVACCDIYRAGDGLHRAWLERRARLLGGVARSALALSPFNRYTLRAESELFTSPRLRAVICISQMVKREIQEHFGLDDARLPIVYNGIDPQVYNPGVRARRQEVRQSLGVPEDVPLFLFVGSGYERKGLDRALAALPASAWLLVVGKDKHEKRYRALAERLGNLARVRFLGAQPDVRAFYGAADAFVFPTRYEPFGNVILEAMACGLPVVTTTDCGGADLIEQGVSGYVHDGEDRDALVGHLGALCDPARAGRLGEAAARVAVGYDLEVMTRRMVGLYQGLLA
ncbi:glycosyltransferase family 4 protein [Dechloromonas sp. H13]|uniref:glycosyltransferase family 4 protein n=1 Tax=Dechloromonas sp. H13 TaxID=2570193 RepID=UPI00129185F7|nr:glycosyltransferase family 4 protein [Dechloromonas sp. H13]